MSVNQAPRSLAEARPRRRGLGRHHHPDRSGTALIGRPPGVSPRSNGAAVPARRRGPVGDVRHARLASFRFRSSSQPVKPPVLRRARASSQRQCATERPPTKATFHPAELDLLSSDEAGRLSSSGRRYLPEPGRHVREPGRPGQRSLQGHRQPGAGADNRYVSKRDTDYELWNRLVGQGREPEIERPETAEE